LSTAAHRRGGGLAPGRLADRGGLAQPHGALLNAACACDLWRWGRGQVYGFRKQPHLVGGFGARGRRCIAPTIDDAFEETFIAQRLLPFPLHPASLSWRLRCSLMSLVIDHGVERRPQLELAMIRI